MEQLPWPIHFIIIMAVNHLTDNLPSQALTTLRASITHIYRLITTVGGVYTYICHTVILSCWITPSILFTCILGVISKSFCSTVIIYSIYSISIYMDCTHNGTLTVNWLSTNLWVILICISLWFHITTHATTGANFIPPEGPEEEPQCCALFTSCYESAAVKQ